MHARIALLRAINVGGRTKLAMTDLKATFEALGFTAVRTLLQTGNVVFVGDGADAEVEARLEAALAQRVGLETEVLVRSGQAWRDMIAANPYPDAARDDPSHMVVMPLKAAPGPEALATLRAAIKGREQVSLAGRCAYLVYPDGIGTSKLTIKIIEGKLATKGTGRNWNTVLKLAEAVAGVQ